MNIWFVMPVMIFLNVILLMISCFHPLKTIKCVCGIMAITTTILCGYAMAITDNAATRIICSLNAVGSILMACLMFFGEKCLGAF